MRNTEDESRRWEASSRRLARQVFYADGEKRGTEWARTILGQLDVEVTPFRSAAECLDCLRCRPCQLLISNARRPGIEGMELLLGARRIKPSVPVVVLVDHGDIEAAVRAMKAGAADCLERPLETGPLASAIDAALRKSARHACAAEASFVGSGTAGAWPPARSLHEPRNRLGTSPLRQDDRVHRSHIMRKLSTHYPERISGTVAPRRTRDR